MPRKSAEYYREYRQRRAARDNPVPNGTSYRKGKNGYFIAWDGEGADYAPNDHRYILLCYATSDGATGSVANPDGLTWSEIANFLCNTQAGHPNAINVIFSGVYDVTMMLRTLMPRIDRVQDFWATINNPDPAKRGWRYHDGHDTWIIRYIPRKQLIVTRYRGWRTNRQGKRVRVRTGGFMLWDCWGFFQSPFVKAIEKHIGKNEPMLPFIKAQKARRSDFNPLELPQMTDYCLAECQLLCTMMGRLRDSLSQAGLSISRWDGAGSIARAMLDMNHIKDHHGTIPDEVMDASCYAYAGGRSELVRYGYHDALIHHYDINSAYPSGMVDLPSFKHGSWVHSDMWRDELAGTFSLCHVTWCLRHPDGIYPFVYRNSNGHISYPADGSNWVWEPELAAYMRHAHSLSGYTAIDSVWTFVPSGNHRPFSFVRDYYAQRQQWVRDGNGAEYPMKLGLNSLYGKTVQQVGSKNGQPPRYYQLQWGGYITSTARAKIYDAMMSNPSAVIMVATDGIYATQPLDLPVSTTKELGEWEYKQHKAIVVVQSGVYWLLDGDEWKSYHRGFLPDLRDNDDVILDGLSIGRVLTGWEEQAERLTVAAPRTFISFGLVAHGMAPFSHLGQWVGDSKSLELVDVSAKRQPPRNSRPNEGLVLLHNNQYLPFSTRAAPESTIQFIRDRFHSHSHRPAWHDKVTIKVHTHGRVWTFNGPEVTRIMAELTGE